MSRARTNPWLVLVVLCAGFFMILLDTTIVNVAIPAMLSALNTTLDQILWVLNAYILVYAVLLIIAGRLGDLYGQRNLFAIGLVITAIFSAGLVLGIFQYMLHREGGVPASRIESPAQDARQLPPEPRLEETPMSDLQEMRAAEDQILHTYGWLDQPNGIVRLPIDRAMELIAQRGLPARKESGPQSAAAAVTVPTASALGPVPQLQVQK